MKKTALFFFLVTVLAAGMQNGYPQDAAYPMPHPQAGYLPYAHAHNDYEHERPLLDALENRFYSVESDFWMVDGQLLVSHDKEERAEDYKGSLKDLYLDPLQKAVDEKGSVHGDGLPFYLWLDIKDGREAMHPLLHELLKNYPMLSVFTEDAIQAGPVTIILTGNHTSKSTYIQKYAERRVCRDSNSYSPDDPDADRQWLWYALRWRSYIDWDGSAPMPQSEFDRLVKLVNDIHSKGRKVRFYAAPDHERYWDTALRAGVDHINTDRLAELKRFLLSKAN